MSLDPRLDPFRTRLSVENAAMLLIDHQEGFFPGIKSIDTADLRNNIIATAKLAARTGMPTVLTSSFAQGINGALMPEITALFPDLSVINRHMVNCWEDPAYVAAVKATGRKKLIMSALTTDVCLVFPAVQAAREGFEVYCVLDASGAWSKRAEDACILRMNNAGCIMTTWVSVAAELLHDHLGPYKEPIQSVFNEHLFGYTAQDAGGMSRAA
ncbi:MAG: isochorismatase family protein [Alphaproteobacteria bacterium]|nr:isochorismatase family protein [Alphaproteobacteria bacterium]